MAANKRVFYAIRKAGIAPLGSTAYEVIHGAQSIGVTTTFNLEQAFELGQIAVYENIEGIPDIEITTEKVLDGWPPVYLLATQGASTATLLGRAKKSCILGMGIYPDTYEASTGNPVTEVHMSGLYVSSFGYEATVDGNVTENVTLIGNNKLWVGTAGETSGSFSNGTHWDGTSSISTNTDQPYSISLSGGIQRRQDIIFGYGTGNVSLIGGVPGSLNPTGFNIQNVTTGEFAVHVQRMAINVDLGREDMFELGRKGPYHKFVNFPVEVTSEVGIISVSGDMISATEEGISGTVGNKYNLMDRRIRLVLREGLRVDCGSKNKLSSIGVTGGDTGGGNEEITYTYSTWNDCTVTHPRDPTTALRV